MKIINNAIKKINNLNQKEIMLLSLFAIGLIFCCSYSSNNVQESFKGKSNCHNVLIRSGKKLHLINTRKPLKIGTNNPIEFNNLEEYVKYHNHKKKLGVNCPILYFQETFNTQGDKGLRLLDDPINPNAGMNSNPPSEK